MSDGATPTPAAPSQGELVLGGGTPPAPNGASGAQTPAPAAVVSAAGTEGAKTPEQVAAEKTAVDAKAAADTKAADEKKTADAKAESDKVWAEFKPARAEGITSDEASLKEFVPLARELGLKPEQAQKLIALNDKFALAQAKAQQAAIDKHYADERAEHLKTSSADKDFGGDFTKATAVANKAFEKYFDPKTVAALKAFNLDVQPGLFKGFYKIGLALKDDNIAGGTGGGVGAPSAQDQLNALYPSMRKS